MKKWIYNIFILLFIFGQLTYLYSSIKIPGKIYKVEKFAKEIVILSEDQEEYYFILYDTDKETIIYKKLIPYRPVIIEPFEKGYYLNCILFNNETQTKGEFHYIYNKIEKKIEINRDNKNFLFYIKKNHLYKKNLENNKIEWDKMLPALIEFYTYTSNYLVVGIADYIDKKQGYYIFDVKTGKFLWKKYFLKKNIYTSFNDEHRIFIVTFSNENNYINIYSLNNGKKLISITEPYYKNNSKFFVDKEYIYFFNLDKSNLMKIYKFSLKSLKFVWEKNFQTSDFVYNFTKDYIVLILYIADERYDLTILDKKTGKIEWKKRIKIEPDKRINFEIFNDFLVLKFFPYIARNNDVATFEFINIPSGNFKKLDLTYSSDKVYYCLEVNTNEALIIKLHPHYFYEDFYSTANIYYFNFLTDKKWEIEFPSDFKFNNYFIDKEKILLFLENCGIVFVNKSNGKLERGWELPYENIFTEYIYTPIFSTYIGKSCWGTLFNKKYSSDRVIWIFSVINYIPLKNIYFAGYIMEAYTKYLKLGVCGMEYFSNEIDAKDLHLEYTGLNFDVCKIKLGYKFIYIGAAIRGFWLKPSFNFKDNPIKNIEPNKTISQSEMSIQGIAPYFNLSFYHPRFYVEIGRSIKVDKMINLNFILNIVLNNQLNLKFLYSDIEDPPFYKKIKNQDGSYKYEYNNYIIPFFAYKYNWRKYVIGISRNIYRRNRFNVMLDCAISYNQLIFWFYNIIENKERKEISEDYFDSRKLNFFNLKIGISFYY